jgi:putative NAD(P)-binding protein
MRMNGIGSFGLGRKYEEHDSLPRDPEVRRSRRQVVTPFAVGHRCGVTHNLSDLHWVCPAAASIIRSHMIATNVRRIAIVGGGIGGLTLAIALRQYGLQVDIYEQTAELREVGAAVALSANATRLFEHFGLGPQFASRWFEVSALIYRDGRSGRVIGEHQAGPSYRQRFGAPYVGIHRADLQAILAAAIGLDRIRLGKRLVGLDDTGAAQRCTSTAAASMSATGNFCASSADGDA